MQLVRRSVASVGKAVSPSLVGCASAAEERSLCRDFVRVVGAVSPGRRAQGELSPSDLGDFDSERFRVIRASHRVTNLQGESGLARRADAALAQ